MAALVGFLAYEGLIKPAALTQEGGAAGPAAPASLPREDAVLVFGASGRSGREIVKALLESGHTVVAGVRSAARAKAVFGGLGLEEGCQPDGRGILLIEEGVDITDADKGVPPALFRGVSQVVLAVGAVFGRAADGTMGYLDNLTPERVDAGGVAIVAAAAAAVLPRPERSLSEILPIRSEGDVARWQRLDDVIMGGQSDSALTPTPDGTGAIWAGTLRVEGGGFCGTRTVSAEMDLSSFDGIALRVRSDGQTFKLNVKTVDQLDSPENVYQATFETRDGEWSDVFLPWHQFVLVKRARSVAGAPPLDPSRVRQLGLVLSRFEYNGFPNPSFHPGPFKLELAGGISAYRDPRPQLLLVSSAGVERNARIGDDAEARKRDIPIVQLNPGGVLNHKYAGEAAVRASGLAYAVVRPTGLTNETEGAPFMLEASQGDRVSGRLTRGELASVVAAAACLPAAVGKTFELRRQESADAKGVAMTPRDFLRLLLGVAPDRRRPAAGLEPMPAVVPPLPPVTEERKKEILSDVRVVRSVMGGRGGRVRDEKETAKASAITVTSDGREALVAADGSAQPAAAAPAAASTPLEDGTPGNVHEAREWIRRWRAGNLERQLQADVPAGSD